MGNSPSVTKQLWEDCVQGSAAACEEAFASLAGLFTRMARRVAFEFQSPDETEDLVQEIYAKLLENRESIANALPAEEFAAQGYLAIMAANTARDWFRARGAKKRGRTVTGGFDDSTRNLAEVLGHQPSVEREVLLREIEAKLDGDAQERRIFRLYYQQGFTANEIAQIPALGLSVKGIESVLLRMGRRLRERLAGNRRVEASQ